MARRMADAKFRNEQWTHRYADHIAPINQLVDELRADSRQGWAPYVAPMYGGVEARLLSVLRDPGPATQENGGSGFLCMENDDPTAEAIDGYFSNAKIGSADIVPWNAYPWYINRAPTSVELDAGVEPWKEIIDLMPNLQVIMLHGRDAQKGWKKLTRRFPLLVEERGLHIIPTYHTSRQAFRHSNPAVREFRRQHLRDAFAEASRLLNLS